MQNKQIMAWVDERREMQKWLGDNDISMYLTHNECKSVMAERFKKILKCKMYKEMTANVSKSYLDYLNKYVDEYNNAYHCSFSKNPINVDCSVLTEKIELSNKAPKFKVGDRVRITKYKNIFVTWNF